jgi:hypothetical protein
MRPTQHCLVDKQADHLPSSPVAWFLACSILPDLFHISFPPRFCPWGCERNVIHVYVWLYSPYGSWLLFQFLHVYTVGRIPWIEDQPVARSLSTRRTTQTQNKRTQTSITLVRFEPTIPVIERTSTVYA